MKSKFVHLIVLLLGLGLAATVAAQPTIIRGRVTDKKTAEALPGANIMAPL